jgi:hypothetical protein
MQCTQCGASQFNTLANFAGIYGIGCGSCPRVWKTADLVKSVGAAPVPQVDKPCPGQGRYPCVNSGPMLQLADTVWACTCGQVDVFSVTAACQAPAPSMTPYLPPGWSHSFKLPTPSWGALGPPPVPSAPSLTSKACPHGVALTKLCQDCVLETLGHLTSKKIVLPVPERPKCTTCKRELSKEMDAYYGKDPKEAAKCTPCRFGRPF